MNMVNIFIYLSSVCNLQAFSAVLWCNQVLLYLEVCDSPKLTVNLNVNLMLYLEKVWNKLTSDVLVCQYLGYEYNPCLWLGVFDLKLNW